MTPEELAVIRARADAATPAPWDGKAYRVYGVPIDGQERIIAACWRPWGPVTGPRSIEADVEFIAHARTDVPALVAEVEHLRRGLELVIAYDDEGSVGPIAEEALSGSTDGEWWHSEP